MKCNILKNFLCASFNQSFFFFFFSEFPLLTAKDFVSTNSSRYLLTDFLGCLPNLIFHVQEISLASDDLLAHYFNDFLSVPVN